MTEDVFLSTGSITIYTLGVALGVGFLTATAFAIPRMRRQGIKRQQVLTLMLALMLFTVLGARLAVIVARWGEHQGTIARMLLIPPDGLSYYGGLVTALFVLAWFCRQEKVPYLTVTDALAPPAAIGLTTGAALLFATNLLHLTRGGAPWLNLLPFTLAYALSYLLWLRRDARRFPGELTLLLLGGDSLLRIVFGSYWALGEGPFSSVRGPSVMLVIAGALWFTLRGAAYRNRGEEPRERADERPGTHPTPWLVGYAVLAAIIVVRLGMV